MARSKPLGHSTVGTRDKEQVLEFSLSLLCSCYLSVYIYIYTYERPASWSWPLLLVTHGRAKPPDIFVVFLANFVCLVGRLIQADWISGGNRHTRANYMRLSVNYENTMHECGNSIGLGFGPRTVGELLCCVTGK
ncbi:hypothetical protein V1506DRAFT_132304 [Lipomyces tetrasporus]